MALPPTSQDNIEYPEYTEKHKIVLMEGEMVSMEGQLLKEAKQLTTITSDDPSAPEERIYKEVSIEYKSFRINFYCIQIFTPLRRLE